MKMIITFLLTGLLLITVLAGCGSTSGSTGSTSGGKARILLIMNDVNDTFRAELANAVTTAATSSGATVDLVESGGSVETEAELVSTAASKGYTAIILRPSDASTALQMNVAAGNLPVIYINNQPSDEHLTADKYIYAGSSEEQAGQLQAEYVLKKLGNPSGLNVIIFEGEQGHSATIGRTNAVIKTLKENGCNATYVFKDYANWSDSEAEYKLGIFMKTGQSVDAIFCNNDTMALGVISGMKKYGLDYTKIPVCGVDATADGCESISSGEMAFTVLQSAAGQGASAVKAAIALGSGGTIGGIEYATDDHKCIYVPFESVDASNVSQYK